MKFGSGKKEFFELTRGRMLELWRPTAPYADDREMLVLGDIGWDQDLKGPYFVATSADMALDIDDIACVKRALEACRTEEAFKRLLEDKTPLNVVT